MSSSIGSLKAPTLMSKKTQKTVQKTADEDDVLIDATAVPTARQEDMEMEEGESSKPNFAPASSSDLEV
jgi:RNA-binding protein PNO1